MLRCKIEYTKISLFKIAKIPQRPRDVQVCTAEKFLVQLGQIGNLPVGSNSVFRLFDFRMS